MRGLRAAYILSVATAAVLWPQAASAGSCDRPVVSGCVNSDTLWPHAGPSRFVGVGGTETVARGKVGFGLVTTYLLDPVVLHVPSPAPTGTDQNAIHDLLDTNFLFAYGVTDRLELGAVLPMTLGQSGSGLSGVTGGDELRDTAVRDARFGAAYAILPRDRVEPSRAAAAGRPAPNVYGLTARFDVSAPTGDRSQFAGERAAVFVPSLAADYRRGRWFAGLELGARIRPTAEFVGARVGTQGVVGLGLGFDILKNELLSAMLEARALPTFSEQHDVSQTGGGLVSTSNGKYVTPAEWMVAVRSAPLVGGDVAFQLAGGGAIPFGHETPITTPLVRFVLGLALQPRGLDSDGDGVLDADDRCPSLPGPRASSEPGCPPPSALAPVTPLPPAPPPATQPPPPAPAASPAPSPSPAPPASSAPPPPAATAPSPPPPSPTTTP